MTALPASRFDGPLDRRSASSSSLPANASAAGALVELPNETPPLARAGLDDDDPASADAAGWAELGGGDDLRGAASA